jgi:competence protein ComEC
MAHRPLIPILLAFMAGILIGDLGFSHPSSLPLPLLVAVATVLFFSLFAPSRLRLPCFVVVFFLVGILLDLCRYHPSELCPLAKERPTVTMAGTVLEPSVPKRERSRVVVRADEVFLEDGSIETRERVVVTIYGHARPFVPGDRILFQGRLRAFKNFNNPGRYDYERAMRVRGLSCAASVSDGRHIVPLGRGSLGFPMGLVESLRKPVRGFLHDKLPPQDAALLKALILGERQDIHQTLRKPFQVAGVAHVLAVSGLHIGLVAWISFALFKGILSLSYRLTLQMDVRKVAALLTCFPVVAYPCLAGFQVSSQRAMMMALAFLFSMVWGREKEVWSTLALAALAILAVDPHAVFSISFQLSFTAVVGILWLAPTLYSRLAVLAVQPEGFSYRLYVYGIGLVAVTLSAIIFLLPVTVCYFHRVSLVALPANLTVVPILGFWVLPLGLLSAVMLPFAPALAHGFVQASAWGMHRILDILGFWTALEWADLWVITPNGFEIALFYALLGAVFFLKRWPRAKACLVALLFFVGLDISYWVYRNQFNEHLEITYLDVGQGNAALIRFPGKEKMLIDGGGFSRSDFDVGESVVAPFLFRSKIRRIDYMVLSHPQTDHMGGLRFIAEHFRPKEFWYNGDWASTPSFAELMDIVEAKKIRKLCPADLKGGRTISGVRVNLLHPPPNPSDPALAKKMNPNDKSLVVKISYGETSCLFPGDLEKVGEDMVVKRAGSLLESHVLLAPHHGSGSSCSKAFLNQVKPRVCIISCGRGNPFRFPDSRTLRRLQGLGCRIFRIDEVGAVQVSVTPKGYHVRSFLR